MISAANATPRFVSAREIEDYRQQVEMAKEETRQVKQTAEAAVDAGDSRFIANVRFPYHFEAGKKPFLVRAMYNDDKFTYIQARPEETPTLYEIKDGKPNLVNFLPARSRFCFSGSVPRAAARQRKRQRRFTRSAESKDFRMQHKPRRHT